MLVLAAKDDELHFRGLSQEFDEFNPVLNGPAFVVPSPPGQQGHPARISWMPFLFDLRGNFRAARQPVKIPMHGHAEQGQDGQITINGVQMRGGARRGEVVEGAGAFAGAFAQIVEADGQAGVGEPGEEGAAGQSLQINGPVKAVLAHGAQAAGNLRPAMRRGPASALEGENAGEVGVLFQQRQQAGVEPPVNIGFWEMAFEQPEDRQRVNHVAHGTGFEDQNFQRLVCCYRKGFTTNPSPCPLPAVRGEGKAAYDLRKLRSPCPLPAQRGEGGMGGMGRMGAMR